MPFKRNSCSPLVGQTRVCRHCAKVMPALGHSTHQRYCGEPFLDVEAFNAKVQRGDDDACWLFTGARVPAGGYGRARMNGRLVAAHRIAWMLANGNIPAGRDIMHWRCDNPPCCNPKHLRPGTEAENMRDMRLKGRDGVATLTPDQVRRVRELLAEGKLNQREIAALFNVKHGVISDINVGGTYQWVEELTEGDLAEQRRLHDQWAKV